MPLGPKSTWGIQELETAQGLESTGAILQQDAVIATHEQGFKLLRGGGDVEKAGGSRLVLISRFAEHQPPTSIYLPSTTPAATPTTSLHHHQFLADLYILPVLYHRNQQGPPAFAHLPTIASIFRRFIGSFAAPNPAAMSAARTKAEGIIANNNVVVFSKSYCPYCRATKQLLNDEGAQFFSIELDQVDDGAAIQDALQEITNQRSVPNIFIDRKHIGGNSDLQARKAELPALLKAAGAV
ncbi:hypothetical protein FQN52_004417 [Onygenales sp. PD_12]|nr:hypothetical protein FQN52_004417 [Onygenales sp. PD_12]